MLCAAYPNYARDNSPATLEQTLHIYQSLLADIPVDVLEATAMQHIAGSRFFPTVAELREGAMAIAAPQYPPAMEAWSEFLNAADSYRPCPEFANPILNAVIRQMGWIDLCRSENQIADRAHFIQAYERLAARAREDAMLLPAVRDLSQRLATGRGIPVQLPARSEVGQKAGK